MREKRSKRKQAFLCLTAVLLIFSLLFTACGAGSGVPSDGSSGEGSAVSPFPDGRDGLYARGELSDDGTTYVNKWAGIRITIPDGFSKGSQEDYDTVEADGDTECGLYLTNEDGSRILFIGFQKLAAAVREETYLDKVTRNLEEEAEKDERMALKTPEAFSFINLGGHEYVRASYQLIFDGKTAYQNYYVRLLDNYMIFAVSTSATEDKIDSLANLIRACD